MAQSSRVAVTVLLFVGLIGGCAGSPAASAPEGAADASAQSTPDMLRGFTEPGGPPPFVLPPPEWQVVCQGVSAELCRSMSHDAVGPRQPNDPAIHTLLVRCTAATCAAGEAEGETILIFVDGSSRHVGSWSVSGPEPAAPQAIPPPHRPDGDWELVCDGVPERECEEFAVDTYEAINRLDMGPLSVLTLACASSECTANGGSVKALATFADGTEREVGSWQYQGSGP